MSSSSLSLLGVVRHRADAERAWFRRVLGVAIPEVYAPMIEKYARHNGHADLLRQSIDGSAGESSPAGRFGL